MGLIRAIIMFVLGALLLAIVGLVAGVARIAQMKNRFFGRTRAQQPRDAQPALDMVRCPLCGVFASGRCSNPDCVKDAG